MDISITSLSDLTQYIGKRLGFFKDVLGWTDFTTSDSPVYEAAVDAVLALNVSDISEVTDYGALRAAAEYFGWLEVLNNAGAFYDFSADGTTMNRSQLQEQAQRNLEQAHAKALRRGVHLGNEIVLVDVTWEDLESETDLTASYLDY